ncbi:helix-turn-helix domain-containing protein [Cryobacterium sp. Y11]|uniref:helix-turn-helix domain-containing protein n=1 Tax=Cryobacterium sp. Y11 TaxID=2045016 RepID=UPI000CE2FB22|nr:helix-turn-helix domain-containing protein [Cryobacterium sp. Y11]
MLKISTTQAADFLNTAFGVTNITDKKTLALVRAGLFANVGSGRSIRIDLAEVEEYATSTRYVASSQWPTAQPIFRVSLLGLREDEIKDQHGIVLRTHAGADYANIYGLTPLMRRRAWTGVWEVSDSTITRAINERALLVGTTKGAVHPEYVRTITGAKRDSTTGRVWWKTKKAPEVINRFVGSGLWMDVKSGRESDWA